MILLFVKFINLIPKDLISKSIDSKVYYQYTILNPSTRSLSSLFQVCLSTRSSGACPRPCCISRCWAHPYLPLGTDDTLSPKYLHPSEEGTLDLKDPYSVPPIKFTRTSCITFNSPSASSTFPSSTSSYATSPSSEAGAFTMGADPLMSGLRSTGAISTIHPQ